MSKRNRNQSAAPSANGQVNGQSHGGADPGAAGGPAEQATPQRRAAPAKPAPAAVNAANSNNNTNSGEADLTDLLMSAVEETAGTNTNENESGPGSEREHEAPAVGDEARDDSNALTENGETESGIAGEQGEAEAEDAEGDSTADQAETDADGEAEGDETLGDLAAMTDEELDEHAGRQRWSDSYTKRVKKFTRAQRSLEAENRRLREELLDREGTESGRAGERESGQEPAIRNPQFAIGAPSAREGDLATRIAQHEEWLDRIDAVAPGESLVLGEQTFGPEHLRKTRRHLETELSALKYDRTAEQRRRSSLVQEGEAEAITRHPWLKDRSNADTVAINHAFNEYPVLKSVPFLRSLIADAMTLRRQQAAKLQAGKANGAKGTTSPRPSPPSDGGEGGRTRSAAPAPAARNPGRPAAAPMPALRRTPDTAAGVKKALASGRMEDAVAVISELVDIR